MGKLSHEQARYGLRAGLVLPSIPDRTLTYMHPQPAVHAFELIQLPPEYAVLAEGDERFFAVCQYDTCESEPDGLLIENGNIVRGTVILNYGVGEEGALASLWEHLSRHHGIEVPDTLLETCGVIVERPKKSAWVLGPRPEKQKKQFRRR